MVASKGQKQAFDTCWLVLAEANPLKSVNMGDEGEQGNDEILLRRLIGQLRWPRESRSAKGPHGQHGGLRQPGEGGPPMQWR